MRVNKRQRLTNPVIRIRQQPTKRVSYWDEVPGLCLQVEPSGYKAFKFAYRTQGGRLRWYNIGNVDAVTLATARDLARQINAKRTLDPTYDPQAEKLAARKAGTFEELAARYRHLSANAPRNPQYGWTLRVVGDGRPAAGYAAGCVKCRSRSAVAGEGSQLARLAVVNTSPQPSRLMQ